VVTFKIVQGHPDITMI